MRAAGRFASAASRPRSHCAWAARSTPTAARLDADAASALVDAMCVAIEIVDSRWAEGWTRRRWPSLPTCSRTARSCSVPGCPSRPATGLRRCAASPSASLPMRTPRHALDGRSGMGAAGLAAPRHARRPSPAGRHRRHHGHLVRPAHWRRPVTPYTSNSRASASPTSSSDQALRKDTAMITLDHHPSGRHFLQIPGPSPVPDRILRAISLPDHRPPRARVRRARPEGRRGHAAGLPDAASGGDLPGLGHRRLGSRAGQHDEPGRRRADGRDRPLRHAVAEDGRRSSAWSRSSWPARHRPAPACRTPGATACRPR